MERMLAAPPVHKAGPVMRLQKIPGDVFAGFLEARFAASGMRANPAWRGHRRPGREPPYGRSVSRTETWDDVRADGGRRAGLEHLHRHARAAAGRNGPRCSKRCGSVSRSPSVQPLRATVLQDGRELPRRHPRAYRLGGHATRPWTYALRARQTVT